MAIYKHLRSSTANKRPTTSIADGQLAINTNTASPGLFFKDSAGTGIVKVGPVHVGTTAPNVSPAAGGSSGNYTGEQWLDTSVSPNQMKVWNGSAWVGIVADELPVSKLQDGTAGQIIQTDSAGTGVEWSSTTNLPIGSAGAPAYSFQSDSNTGIYSPGVDQVAISTGGTGRLFVASDGKVGIGTNSPSSILHCVGSKDATNSTIDAPLSTVGGSAFGNYSEVLFRNTSGSNSNAAIRAYGNAWDSLGSALGFLTSNNSAPVERLYITSDGKVGIGTGSPNGLLALGFADAGSASLEFRTTSYSNLAQIAASNPSSDTGEITFRTRTGGTAFDRAKIDGSGRLLVGTSTNTGGALLQINDNRIRIATAKTPASATDTGSAGEICWDASYIYVCTATNTWKRTAIATW